MKLGREKKKMMVYINEIECQNLLGRELRKESKVHKVDMPELYIIYVTSECPPAVYAPQEATEHSLH